MCAVFRQIAPKQLDTGIAARADRLCFQCLRFIGCRHFTRNDVLQIPFQRQTVDQRIAVPQAPHFHAAPVAVRKLCAICITDHHTALLLRRHRKCSLCISCHLIGCSNQRLRCHMCCLSLPGDRCVCRTFQIDGLPAFCSVIPHEQHTDFADDSRLAD